MGLRNASLTFQQMVNSMFVGIIVKGFFVYLDYLIIVSKDSDSHLQKLALVFHRLTQFGLKVTLTKFGFLKLCIKFFGHVFDGNGIHMVDSKISAVKTFPTPKTTDNLCSCLGFAGYHRALVKDFVSIALPLTRILWKGALSRNIPVAAITKISNFWHIKLHTLSSELLCGVKSPTP